jgi:hypothetical protein
LRKRVEYWSWVVGFKSSLKSGSFAPALKKTLLLTVGEMGLKCCHGPSVPVKHTGRKSRAPWPTRQTAARQRKSAIPVGMTNQEKNKEHSQEWLCHIRQCLLRRAGGGGEFDVGLGDYAGLERGPAGVGGGIAAEADYGVRNFGRADGAV